MCRRRRRYGARRVQFGASSVREVSQSADDLWGSIEVVCPDWATCGGYVAKRLVAGDEPKQRQTQQRAEASDASDPGSSQGTRPSVLRPPDHHMRRRCQQHISERGLACCSVPCREHRGSRRGVSTVSCSAQH
ncbi:hypothetical protein HPB52_022711 [Rhipicephalus sanguineus]|uniref:Uncharacterized protein n=1 Tax=Rhipicephalus sanguineus TaxID=34632 RepID=A0A9D4T2A4_RHISA|nr:hypothetical protein HPB52_022711 [Rhipicephalus sanguineus]